jgi:hypothetical protein
VIAPEEFIVNAAEGAAEAQRKLEGAVTADYLSGTPMSTGTMYAFRTIAFDARFLLQTIETKMVLVFRVGETSKNLANSLSFALEATPMPPPDTLVGAMPEVRLGLPRFMLTRANDEKVVAATRALMTSIENQPPSPWTSDQIKTAIGRLDEEPNKGRGPVAFRLMDDDSLFLVVDVSDKQHPPDGLYVYDERLDTVKIYSIPDVSRDSIQYEPLNQFALAVHRVLYESSGLHTEQVSDPVGLIPGLDDFAGQLATGYQKARSELAQKQSTSPLIPSYLDLSPLRAKIRYSVTVDAKGEKGVGKLVDVNDDEAQDSQEEQFKATVGSAEIVVSANGMVQTTEVTIGMPSFVLSGNTLKAFIQLAQAKESADAIVTGFKDDSVTAETYRNSLATRGDVVVLQAFEKNKPNGDVLVVWQGTGDGNGRQFIFGCHINFGKDESTGTQVMKELKDVKPVMKLGQAIATAVVTDAEYQPFHNMFHAIQLWNTTLRSA